MKQKVIILGELILIIIIIGLLFWLKNENKDISKSKNNLEETINVLNIQNENQKEEIEMQANIIRSLNNKLDKEEQIEYTKCKSTLTFNVIDILDYTGPVLGYKYVLVDKFQEFEPYIIRLKETFKIDKNKNYEITFYGYQNIDNIETLINSSEIMSVIETSKQGMEQINKYCIDN